MRIARPITIKIPYGKQLLDFVMPDGIKYAIVLPPKNKIIDEQLLIAAFIKDNYTRLKNLLDNKKRALMIVPDQTRKAHLKGILNQLIPVIDNKTCRIDFIIATGLHKDLTHNQIAELLGDNVANNYQVYNHSPLDESVTQFGSTSNDIPIYLNKKIAEYDFIMSFGVIEPHLYAGYSGGVKTISVGLAGEKTINRLHSLQFLDHPNTKIGNITTNTFQQTLQEIAANNMPDISLNVVNDASGNLLKIFLGETKSIYAAGTKFCHSKLFTNVPEQADIVICGIGYPKDCNLYQASRAVNYLLNVNKPILKKGGKLIIAAELVDGIGEGLGEQRFYEELCKIKSAADFIKQAKEHGISAGAHRTYMVTQAMLEHEIILVTNWDEKYLKPLPFPYFRDMESALSAAIKNPPANPLVYIVPHSLATITEALDF